MWDSLQGLLCAALFAFCADLGPKWGLGARGFRFTESPSYKRRALCGIACRERFIDSGVSFKRDCTFVIISSMLAGKRFHKREMLSSNGNLPVIDFIKKGIHRFWNRFNRDLFQAKSRIS